MRRRLAVAFLAAVAFTACKREAATPPASPTAAPSASTTPAAASMRISYFVPEAHGPGDMPPGCEWVSQDVASATRTVLAAIDGSCDGARVAWSADRTRAVLWTDANLFMTGPGGGAALLAPPVGVLRDIGYDSNGTLFALTLEEIPAAQARKGFVVAETGDKLPVPKEMDGLPALARAYKWSTTEIGWKRVETKVSDDAWDLAIGVAALDAEKTLGARSWKMLSHTPDGREATPAEARTLDAACPRAGEDQATWLKLDPEPIFVRLEETEFVVLLPPLCHLDEKGVASPLALQLDPDDSIAVQRSGTWMLVSDSGGRRPHLVDLTTRKTVWSSQTAKEAVFWP